MAAHRAWARTPGADTSGLPGGANAAVEETLITAPRRRRTIPGSAAWVRRTSASLR
jgi:hypothetical protein